MIRICEYCKEEFETDIRNKRFCSRECSDKFFKKMERKDGKLEGVSE
jgi:hypothetical protein